MQFKKYKRTLKEQIIKSKLRSMIKQKVISNKYEEPEAKAIITGSSKAKLENVIKHLHFEPDNEDEEEIIDLDETPKNTDTLNSIYNKKKEEINRVIEAFEKVMNDCKERKLQDKVIKKLQEKQMEKITQISAKFSKL